MKKWRRAGVKSVAIASKLNIPNAHNPVRNLHDASAVSEWPISAATFLYPPKINMSRTKSRPPIFHHLRGDLTGDREMQGRIRAGLSSRVRPKPKNTRPTADKVQVDRAPRGRPDSDSFILEPLKIIQLSAVCQLPWWVGREGGRSGPPTCNLPPSAAFQFGILVFVHVLLYVFTGIIKKIEREW